MSKAKAIKNLRRGTASIAWPIEAVCSSCRSTWASKDQASMDEFYFTVPGGFEAFVCPICRHMAGYIIQPVSFADMRAESEVVDGG